MELRVRLGWFGVELSWLGSGWGRVGVVWGLCGGCVRVESRFSPSMPLSEANGHSPLPEATLLFATESMFVKTRWT